MRGIIDVFAAYERAIIRSRTKAALAVKKAKGLRVGNIPYGYRLAPDGRHVVEDEREQASVKRARSLRGEGKSLRAIAVALADAGHTPRRGLKWHVQVIKRLVG